MRMSYARLPNQNDDDKSCGHEDMSRQLKRLPTRKRIFDLALALFAAPIWLPTILIAGLGILLTEGWPLLYVSKRRTHLNESWNIIKFRTMVRNADRVANRTTLAITDTCFLNIPSDSLLYTPVGRAIERCHFTELPQLLHVLSGRMSVIGCRPLPESVIAALSRRFPGAEDRFLTKAGLTGPVQLVGRDNITDEDRLNLEIEYALSTLFSYSIRLDIALLLMTVWVASGMRGRAFSAEEVRSIMAHYSTSRFVRCQQVQNQSRLYFRYPVRRKTSLDLTDGRQVSANILDIGYHGARMSVATTNELAVGDIVLLPDIEIDAHVRWIDRQNGTTTFGLNFENNGPRGTQLVTLIANCT